MGVIKPVAAKIWLPSRGLVAALALAAGFLPIFVLGTVTNPDVLWDILHRQCVPDQKTFGHPAPCAKVDLAAGYVVLKDIVGATQYLLMPIARITGIESPALLRPGAPNFFADAWEQRGLVEARLGKALPRQDLSLAVNSIYGRSQNQLHIHIDCIAPAVARALAAHLDTVGPVWSRFPVRLAGERYEAMRIDGETLAGANPVHLLAERLPGARQAMGDYTLVVVGATFAEGAPGFVLLAGRARLAAGDLASGEALQDHRCAIAR